MLIAHQVLGAVREEDPGRHRDTVATAVLRAGDPAQVLVQPRDLPPFTGQLALDPLGARPLRVGLLSARLVLPGRDGRVLVQPRHPRTGVGRSVPVTVARPGRQHGERAQQHRNEQRMTAR
ncbi:hypothetical protein OG506_24010 [Streptomyces sp. NBC_00696]|nr:hypothetical protein [Streptomyces sp. NBC_00696]